MVLKTIPINLDLEIIEKLREIAYQHHTSISAIVREAIDLYLSSIEEKAVEKEEEKNNPKIKVDKKVVKINVSEAMIKENRRGGFMCPICKKAFVDEPFNLLKKVAKHLIDAHRLSDTVVRLCVNDKTIQEIDIDEMR